MAAGTKFLKKGAVARFREYYNNVTKKPLTFEQREELLKIFQKKDKTDDATEKTNIKRVAKSNQDCEI